MAELGGFELRVLLAILRCQDAYAVTVRDEIAECTGRRPSLGSIYITLQRLEEKRLIRSRLGDPTPARGGRAKRFFTVTRDGLTLAREHCRATRRLWRGLGLVPEV